jgi:hypothetical protein
LTNLASAGQSKVNDWATPGWVLFALHGARPEIYPSGSFQKGTNGVYNFSACSFCTTHVNFLLPSKADIQIRPPLKKLLANQLKNLHFR